MSKKPRHIIVLSIAVLVGFFLIVPLQQILLASPELIASLGVTTSQSDWAQKIVPQITPGFWICSLIAVLIWIAMATSVRPISSRSARSKRVIWWFYVAILIIIMILTFYFAVSVVNSPIAAELQYFSIFVVIPLNIVVGFWLPTALATPGTLKFIPPLAMNLRGKLGI